MSDRIDRLKKAGLIGCFDDTGVTSENYKDCLYGKRMTDKTKALEELEKLKHLGCEMPGVKIRHGRSQLPEFIPIPELNPKIEELKAMLAKWKPYKEPCSCCNHTDDEYCMPGYKGEDLKAMIEKIVEILDEDSPK